MFVCSLNWRALVYILSTVFLLSGCQVLPTDDDVTVPQNDGTDFISSTSEQQPLPIKPEKDSEKSHCNPTITRTEAVYKPLEIGNKIVIGAIEKITFEQMGIMLDARIDTGALTSSLSATDIRPFERDGKQWVSFRVHGEKDDKKNWVFERRIVRNIMIKRHEEESQLRPVVKLKILIGQIKQIAEFTLTDRSQFEFPVLVGRNILTDIAIVDASYEYLAPKKK